MRDFVHLHVHSQYSILDGASSVDALVEKAKSMGMKAIALTDHGNLFGAKHFHDAAKKADIKPIIGCETYVARRNRHVKTDVVDRSGYHLILLAKNKTGYHNLVKLCSYAYTEGMYYKPRIDRELLEKYHEGLIVSTACLGGEIPQRIMEGNIKAAEEALMWYKNLFGDDFYLELTQHKTNIPEKNKEVYDNQVIVNKALIELSIKFGVKLIATNDCHFLNKEDAEAHDRLICLNTGKDLDDPTRMRYTMEEYVKSTSEMESIFPQILEALDNTMEIANKVEQYKLDQQPVMPDFPIPPQFKSEGEYLRHITYLGAKERYGEITDEIKERIDFELDTIVNMGFPGYFLIVWDFIKAAREMGVIVGPGRGSAAGSVVAYCIKITNIDPIKYDLLFERFLNPDRISMPDIDIDFDDDGRQQVLDWVVDKYGNDKVGHIITFGTMAAKMAIRDIARVQKLPLSEADKLSKLVPEGPKVTLKKAFQEVPELKTAKESGDKNVITTLKYAETLEGCVRQTGVHACGIIICRDDLTDHIPVCTAKDTHLLVTQFDGRFVEPVGMLKMDFLGLKTLSIIKECLLNIKRSKDIDIDIDNIPLDDKKTFDLYSRGETTALFQFESDGMKKHLRNLKPNRFEDLVAMNALYRPGPMDYIPQFVARKHGKEVIVYDHPMMESFLKDTYGITVYQEQVMLQSRSLGGFTRGMSDSLRKAMGKKNEKLMNELKVKFEEGCLKNEEFMKGCRDTKKDPKPLIDKIWADWAAFAKYAFNKSHSVCYAYVSYQTAYLKAHYPAEFMAAVLSNNLADIKKITTFMDECRRMGLKVLCPDVNESHLKFTVNHKGEIRFGMAAIKGVGESAVDEIIANREKNGTYKDIFDFVERINMRTVNKKNMENLVVSGAFDSFENIRREHFFAENNKAMPFLETLMKYGSNVQQEKSSSQMSLFGSSGGAHVSKPEIPQTPEWAPLVKLNKEKELVGIYLSAHPLDNFKIEMKTFCTAELSQLENLTDLKGRELSVAGMVTLVQHLQGKTGKPYGTLTVEDYSGSYKFMLFGQDYNQFKDFMILNTTIFIKGKVQERAFNAQELEFKLLSIKYLSDLRQKYSNLAIKISINNLTENVIDEIADLAETNKGTCALNFLVYDPEFTKTWVNLHSRGTKININENVIDFLEANDIIEYKLS